MFGLKFITLFSLLGCYALAAPGYDLVFPSAKTLAKARAHENPVQSYFDIFKQFFEKIKKVIRGIFKASPAAGDDSGNASGSDEDDASEDSEEPKAATAKARGFGSSGEKSDAKYGKLADMVMKLIMLFLR